MPYLGRTPTPVPVTADDIPANSITADKIKDGVIEIADIGPTLQAEIDSIYTEDDYIVDEMVDMAWAK
jgi:DNA-directed RNA polymerase subunit F